MNEQSFEISYLIIYFAAYGFESFWNTHVKINWSLNKVIQKINDKIFAKRSCS